MSDYYEKQYSVLDDNEKKIGLAQFGPMASFTWNTDPKRLLFVLSRYKFAARILEGFDNVLEIGCGDGFAARIVSQHVKRLVISDVDPKMVDRARKIQSSSFPVDCICHNFVTDQLEISSKIFNGVYLLDVLEHIDERDENLFFKNVKDCMSPDGTIVVGMPSLESQEYASEESKEGHINCKTKEGLHNLMKKHFRSCSAFSMNDEVVHTGFARMSNYVFCVGSGLR